MGIEAFLRRSWQVRLAAVAIAFGLVVLDLLIHQSADSHISRDSAVRLRIPMSWLAIVCLGGLARWDMPSLGLRMKPVQGWGYWLKASLIMGLVALALIGIAAAILYALGRPVMSSGPPVPWTTELAWNYFVRFCFEAPLYEETIYRFALCASLVGVIGRWPTIAISGVVFAGLHVVYGNLGPDNAIAGLLFAWAYLHSGSLAVPILMHAFGNLVVLAVLFAT